MPARAGAPPAAGTAAAVAAAVGADVAAGAAAALVGAAEGVAWVLAPDLSPVSVRVPMAVHMPKAKTANTLRMASRFPAWPCLGSGM